MLGRPAEVARHARRQLEQQPHDQRRPHLVRRRLDPPLDQEGRGHLEREVERGREAQVSPGGAAEHQAFAEGVAQGVGGDDDPLRAGAVGAAEVGELGEEGGHVGAQDRFEV
jgi:hypothetical protein